MHVKPQLAQAFFCILLATPLVAQTLDGKGKEFLWTSGVAPGVCKLSCRPLTT